MRQKSTFSYSFIKAVFNTIVLDETVVESMPELVIHILSGNVHARFPKVQTLYTLEHVGMLINTIGNKQIGQIMIIKYTGYYEITLWSENRCLTVKHF